jgi:hypothetical protein
LPMTSCAHFWHHDFLIIGQRTARSRESPHQGNLSCRNEPLPLQLGSRFDAFLRNRLSLHPLRTRNARLHRWPYPRYTTRPTRASA